LEVQHVVHKRTEPTSKS